MPSIRPCDESERDEMFAMVNAAAEAYRDVIPADRWSEPYMTARELEAEIVAGVAFWGYEDERGLRGIMGTQQVRDVELIRHAYVRPDAQGQGVGRALLEHLRGRVAGQMLVGTWAAAAWAIRFYERNGFALVDPATTDRLLRDYWDIPDRQVETSVVLADPPITAS